MRSLPALEAARTRPPGPVMKEAAVRKRKEMLSNLPGVTRMHPRWEAILRGDHALSPAQRLYRRLFAVLPSPWRCKFCNAPFKIGRAHV